jgi:hypothetical protein
MQRIAGSISAHTRWAAKWLKSFKSGKHAPRDFHRHRYPGIDPADLMDRVRRFQDIIGNPAPIAIDRLSDQIFRMRMGLRHAASA